MSRRRREPPQCEQHQPNRVSPGFAQPFDHATRIPARTTTPIPPRYITKYPTFASGWEAVGENERERRHGAVERADGDRVDPDQPLRRLPGSRNHAPDGTSTRLVDDAVLAAGRDLLA